MAESGSSGSQHPHVDKLLEETTPSKLKEDSSFQTDAMVAALTRLKDKISRLELDRQAAESDMRKLAEETSLFREQMQGFDRECRRPVTNFSRNFSAIDPPAVAPPSPPPLQAGEALSQVSIGPRHFEVRDTEDEFFLVPEASMVAELSTEDEAPPHVVSNTLDIVENRCFALENEFKLMREILEDADRNSLASRELLLSNEAHRKRAKGRLDGQLLALLGPSPPPAKPRLGSSHSDSRLGAPEPPNSGRSKRRRPKAPPSSPRLVVSFEDVAGNLRPSGKTRKAQRASPAAPAPSSRAEQHRRQARALLCDLHVELEGLKQEHRLLAARLAGESNRAQKAVLVQDLERVVRNMEQKGLQVGRLRTYMRAGKAGPGARRAKGKEAGAASGEERELLRKSAIRKVNPTLSVGDVRWTSAP